MRFGLVVLGLIVLGLAGGSRADVIPVTTTVDEHGTGSDCSLREAIQAANDDATFGGCPAGSGADEITLPAGTYTLTIGGAGEDANATGDLDVLADLTITGAGATTTIIDGAGLDRVLDVRAGTSATLTGLTLTGGSVAGNGGCLASAISLTLTDAVVSGCSAQDGGGLALGGGASTISRSTVSGNTAAGAGGGLQVASGASATVATSTISGNTAAQGGGIDDVDTLTLRNTTVAGNTATGANGGGGILNSGTLTLKNVTVAGNTASAADSGGLATSGTTTAQNSILADDVGTTPGSQDCAGTITSAGHNLVEETGGCTIAGDTTGNVTGSDPTLGVLADNGGGTLTKMLLVGSPALDAGDPGTPGSGGTTCEADDQIGTARPVGTGCDIGAVEAPVGGATTTTTTSTSTTSTTDTSTTSSSTSTTDTSTSTTDTSTTTTSVTTTTSTTSTTLPLPSPWLDQDVGSVGLPGTAGTIGTTFIASGSGTDIWDFVDAFHFVYQPLTGDGEIIAQVTSLANTDPWAKAGVMIRESLAEDSLHAMVVVSAGNGTAFQRRNTIGGLSTGTTGPVATVPYWVRLVRSGDTFSGYVSPDGTTWTLIDTDTITMAASVYIGLPVTAHNNTLVTTATFDDVSLSGGVATTTTTSSSTSSTSTSSTTTSTVTTTTTTSTSTSSTTTTSSSTSSTSTSSTTTSTVTTTTTSSSTTSSSSSTSTSTSSTTTSSSTSTSTSSTSTTSTTLAPVCANGTTISKAVVMVGKLGLPVGDERLAFSGVLDLPQGTPPTFDPAGSGAQILVEDLATGSATGAFDLTHLTTPVPAGPRGSGCARKDGWKRGSYQNVSGALDPPTCPAGSAHGLKSVRLVDHRAKGRGIAFVVKARRASVPPTAGPLRGTFVLGATAAESLAGDCGVVTFTPTSCKRRGATLTCR